MDVLVAGAGPAGSVVALCLARRGWRVGLAEATAFEGERYGETLPPEINPLLRELELSDAFAATNPLESPGIVSVWGAAEAVETDFLHNAHGPGWHIDRLRFDSMLCDEARKAGVEVRLCHRATGQPGESRFLVDATGRQGLAIDGPCLRECDDELLAIVLRVQSSEPPLRDLRTFIEATSSGWWYTAPVPGGDVVAMFFTSPGIYAADGVSIGAQLKAAPLTARRFRGRMASSAVVHAPSWLRSPLYGDGWLATGDSASAYDPLSGRGVFKALRQAKAAADAIDAALRGDEEAPARYAARVRREFQEYADQRRLYYASETRWAGHKFWQACVAKKGERR